MYKESLTFMIIMLDHITMRLEHTRSFKVLHQIRSDISMKTLPNELLPFLNPVCSKVLPLEGNMLRGFKITSK